MLVGESVLFFDMHDTNLKIFRLGVQTQQTSKEEKMQSNSPIPKPGLRYRLADPNTQFQTRRILKLQLQFNR